jgi:hypothetical protein
MSAVGQQPGQWVSQWQRLYVTCNLWSVAACNLQLVGVSSE